LPSSSRQYPPLTSPPPLPVTRPGGGGLASQILYTERRFGPASHGLSAGSSFYRSSAAGETLPRIHRNPIVPITASTDSPILLDSSRHRRLAASSGILSSGGGNYVASRKTLDETASAVATDLLYRYGGAAGMTADSRTNIALDRSRSSSYRQPQSQHHHQQHSSQLLCRCGSGGALPSSGPSGSPPPAITSAGLVSSSFGPTSSFRGVQSLPSTPNALRRPLSPPFQGQQPLQTRPFIGLEVAPPSGRVGFSDIGPPIRLPPPPQEGGVPIATQGVRQDHFLFGSDGGPVSESAILAGDLSSTEDGIGGRLRALQQFNHQQTRSLRYRSSSQPIAKLSTLVIVILALIIIGFIVLSPLFHYIM